MSTPSKHKNLANAKESVKCTVCCQVTVGEDEALYCTRKFGWMHCYCARVSFTQYQELSSESAGIFLCLTCSQQANDVMVKELKATIKNLTEEVAELRSAIQWLETRKQPQNATTPSLLFQIHLQLGRPSESGGVITMANRSLQAVNLHRPRIESQPLEVEMLACVNQSSGSKSKVSFLRSRVPVESGGLGKLQLRHAAVIGMLKHW